MWYTVKCNVCGKEEQVQLYGPTKDREWKAQNHTCKECWLKHKREMEDANTNQTIRDMGIEAVLPELEGSEKQIKWATDIRRQMIQDLRMSGFRVNYGNSERRMKFWNEIYMDNSSKNWIDRRNCTASQLIKSWNDKRRENENVEG